MKNNAHNLRSFKNCIWKKADNLRSFQNPLWEKVELMYV